MVVYGVTINPGEIKNVPKRPNDLINEGLLREIDEGLTREKLLNLPMQKLRKIGYKYNCADTNKKELVEEILRAIGG